MPGTGTRDYDGNQLATGELKASVLAPGKWLQGAKSPWPERVTRLLAQARLLWLCLMFMVKLSIRKDVSESGAMVPHSHQVLAGG